MPKPLAAAFDAIRESLWLMPALAVGVAILAAELMVWLSRETRPGWLPQVFGGGADAAQALLQVIAGSVITVAGVTFSVTIIALQLTSTQFSPRVLRNFMRDRGNQSVLAAFLGTFTYCLLVLASMRSATQDEDAFVPIPALGGAIALTLLSLGMLVYFIHHIAHTIQVSSITQRVTNEARETIRRVWRPAGSDDEVVETGAGGEETVLPARESGYLVYVAQDRLIELAAEADGVLRVHGAPGEWISSGRPLVSVAPREAAGRLKRDPRDQVKLGSQPTLQQDVAFGVRQLVDIALKALSPSLNDPTTAVNCIHRLTELLLETGRRSEPPMRRTDEAGRLRLVAPMQDFAQLTALAFDQLRHFGGERVYVALAMAEAFETLVADLPAHRHPPVLTQARLLLAQSAIIQPEPDRRTVQDAVQACLDRSATGPAAGSRRQD